MSTALAVGKRLGLPLHLGKCEDLTTVLVVLGIELDSINQAAHLPADKLSALQGLISSWLPRRWCNLRKLESLMGHLHSAANVVWMAEPSCIAWSTFCAASARTIILFASTGSFICTCPGSISSCHSGKGVSFWLFPALLPEVDVAVPLDAPGSLGYGVFLKGFWFAGSQVPSQQNQSIAYQELLPAQLLPTFGATTGAESTCSYNDAVVHISNAKTSKVPCLMWLLRILPFAAARHSFS